MALQRPTAKVMDTSGNKDYVLLFCGNPRRAVATVEPLKGSNVPVFYGRLRSAISNLLIVIRDILIFIKRESYRL